MVKDIHPEARDADATRYVTIIYSAYAFAQFATNILWGRLSDLIGRRPVMLLGLVSVLIGTVGLGFSQSIASILVFRMIPGLLSGNVVITRTMIGDMVHGRENKCTLSRQWENLKLTVHQQEHLHGTRPCIRLGMWLGRYLVVI